MKLANEIFDEVLKTHSLKEMCTDLRARSSGSILDRDSGYRTLVRSLREEGYPSDVCFSLAEALIKDAAVFFIAARSE